VDSAGVEGNNASADPSTSSDGRYVAFESSATNLVAGDTNGDADVFVHDRQTGATRRVSILSDGTTQGDDRSYSPSISSDGRYVAFESDATNLLGVGIDTNGWPDIFVHDRDADGDGIYDEPAEVSTVRVSVVSDETESIDPSNNPSISSDGRYVAFESGGELDLTAIEILLFPDIFVHDRDTDGDGIYDEPGQVSTIRMSEDSAGSEANAASSSPSISADGRFVAFESSATNLVPGGSDGSIHIFVHDRDTDGNGIYDQAGGVSTVQVSVDSAGAEGDAGSSAPSISGDGRYAAFGSSATNLVPGGSNGSIHIFVHDRDADGNGIYDQAGGISTVQVSVDSAGAEGDNNSNFPSISSDGRYVAFESLSTNLVVGDTLGFSDIFVHDRDTDGDGLYDEPGEVSTTRVSVDLASVEGNGDSNSPSMSADGSSVTFESVADNLVAGDMPFPLGFPDIFVDDLQAGAGGGGGGGSSSGGGGCFISTAADGSRMAGEK
jgi:Tol biopolymer transport system component